ncbi:2-oxoglutarate and iron-dependent oxygenase domain-containing protein [uncultured Tateyamaria sp.]|uniref:isopenicillin N synthase family dioxygenase n=1 Tax=uncultured Tateyamaria sp. TaxID=455651 RepID=UPI00261646C9|nr:2-oxoglutarate and iron-dependent oxygenase domain-containing protein [uncultured Tateyamaria sp.]
MTDTPFAAARATDAKTIPVIDISTLMAGEGVDAVSQAIYAAATDHGFFYVSGHGIAQSLMDRAFDAAARFFALNTEAKASVAIDTYQRGWMAQGMSRLDGADTHDLKEVFFWAAEVAEDDPDWRAGKPMVAPNQWPDAVCPDLRRGLAPYHAAVCDVGRRLMSAIALSLGQPADQFDAAYAKPLARGQAVYYPPSTQADEAARRYGVAPHTDFGVLTLLLQDASGGLQVRARSGEWIEAPPIDGTLVCNIGDLLARWSNDRFNSTLHRVINRTEDARYSIPVFFDPHTDTVVDPADLGVARADCLHDPVTVGAHIASRNRKSFAQYKDA